MPKLTRALTREIEVGGVSLAVTLTDKGLSLRPASGGDPLELTWAALVAAHAGKPVASPSDKDLASALAALGDAAASKPVLADVLARLDAYLKKNRPGYHKALRPGAKAPDLTKLEKALGLPLPEELRTWLTWHNGQSEELVGCFVESFCLLDAKQIAQRHKERKEEADELWNDAYVPLLDDFQGDLTVIDTRTNGIIQLWRGHDKAEVVAPSLAAWLGELASDFEVGRYVEDSERGEMLRASEE